MTTQPQPDLFDRPQAADDADLVWLENLLKGARCWMTARDIMLTVAGRVKDRDLRELASRSDWIISGQKGYKHIEHATSEEVSHAANWLESQAKQMADRAGRIRRSAHRIFG